MYRVLRYSELRFPGNVDTEEFDSYEQAKAQFESLKGNCERVELEDDLKTLETWGREME